MYRSTLGIMKFSFSKISIFLLFLSLNFCCFKTNAQSKLASLTYSIDSLAQVGLPKSALKLVDSLDELARKSNNTLQQIKASLYRIEFLSSMNEDAQVSAIKRLKIDINKANYPAKPVLQSILAEIYWQYYNLARGIISQRSKLQQADSAFNNWDLQTLITETGRLYSQSLLEAEKEQKTPVSILNGVLEGDSTIRYLRPTLYDLLVHRALDFFLADESGINKPKMPFSLNDPRFFSDSRTFADLQIKTTDTASTYFEGLKYLQKATAFHLVNQDDEALADLDLKRLKFLNEHATIDRKDSLYLGALNQIAEQFSAKPISTVALALEGKYYQDIDSLTIAHAYFKKAFTEFPKSNSIGRGYAAFQLYDNIEKKELSATVEDVNIPGKAILGLLSYRNVKEVEVSIYRISEAQIKALPQDDDSYRFSTIYGLALLPRIIKLENALKMLQQLAPVQQKQLSLPGTNDYRNHTVEFEIKPLALGRYVVLIKESKSAEQTLLSLASFQVTHLAYVSRLTPDNKMEIRVMDRETGATLNNVHVKVFYLSDLNGKSVKNIVYSGITNVEGKVTYVHEKNRQYFLALNYKNDNLIDYEKCSCHTPETNENNGPRNSTSLYTDRQIYRPGQTIYFKGIRFSTFNGKSNIIPNTYLNIELRDANNNTIAVQQLKTNEFGSVHGSFIIPQNTLNGQISLYADNVAIYFFVEEYKRPSFQVIFTPVSQIFHLNDTLKAHGIIRAFSGYGISGAKIAVHVTAKANSLAQDIETDTISANESGDFTIMFKPTGKIPGLLKGYVNYTVEATVTDASGETRTASTNIKASDSPINLDVQIPEKIFAGTDPKIPIRLFDINERPQIGTMQVKIFSLKGSGQVYKKRLWAAPDQFLLNTNEFKKNFPDYAWKHEDEFSSWIVANTIYDEKLNITDTTYNILSLAILKRQASGTYKIIINARNAGGDTTSLKRFVNIVANSPKAQTIDDWVIPVVNNVKKGQNAKFLIGINKDVNILMETKKGSKLLSSRILNIKGRYQHQINVPVPLTKKNDFSVQFLMVNNNRRYNFYQKIKVIDTNKNLNIKFLTFRNKLQSGEKEQWKLQVKSNNNKVLPVEMLADFYDASLDDVAPAEYWQTDFNFGSEPDEYFIWNNDEFVRNYQSRAVVRLHPPFYSLERYYERLDRRIDDEIIPKIFGYWVKRFQSIHPYENTDTTIVNIEKIPRHAVKTSVKASNAYKVNGLISYNPIPLRSNFAETAFFYPQLQTNEKGEILIDFTIPEALTRWKFRGFAHTKDLSTGYIENTVVTQKQLSISANTPRFLREGDTITISARLANLTAGVLKGKVQLKLFNALNMQPVNLFADKGETEQSFEVAGNTNKAIAFRLVIPAGLDALTYRLTADAGQYTDGEENTLPVLPNRMLVTESMPMMVRAGQTRNFTFDKLVNQSSTTLKNKTLTLEYTQNPAWYAVQALPYMMEFPYECSEQVFSRYYANTLATSIVNKMPAIKRVFEQWKSSNSAELLSNLEKNQELKSTLIEETPWLNDAISESEQKKRIALLFDLNKMSDELKLNLDKLQKRQLPDGGFTWFGGNTADRYITQHIVEGIGELFHLGIANNQDTLKAIVDNALKYLDNQLIADEQYRIKNKLPKYYGDLEIHAWYSRSFYLDRPLTKDLQKMLSDYLNWAQTAWTTRNVYEQGLIALTMQRYKKPQVTAQIEKSLLETAQHSDELGMYWATNRQGYFWYESPVETQSLLIEVFTEAGDNTKAVDEMKICLLRNKQTNDWKTTKATAAACYALLLKGNDLLADTVKSTIKLNGKPLEELRPDVKADAGTGYIKTTWVDDQIKPQLGKVEINNTGKNISWGALHWQYLENLDKITSAQTNIHLDRNYFIQKQTDAGPVLTAVDATHQPKTGDLLKVVVHLKADRDFEYVQLKDMRPAGTEPVEALSTYKYQDGLYYYQVSKDVATNFFISELSKGSYVFEYQLRVAQPGNFSTGVTSVQCMYAPEFNAHSQGERMGIKP